LDPKGFQDPKVHLESLELLDPQEELGSLGLWDSLDKTDPKELLDRQDLLE